MYSLTLGDNSLNDSGLLSSEHSESSTPTAAPGKAGGEKDSKQQKQGAHKNTAMKATQRKTDISLAKQKHVTSENTGRYVYF